MFGIAFFLSSLRLGREIFEISNNQKANIFFFRGIMQPIWIWERVWKFRNSAAAKSKRFIVSHYVDFAFLFDRLCVLFLGKGGMSTQQESETHRFSSFGTIKNIIFIKGFHWRGIIASLLLMTFFCKFFRNWKISRKFERKILLEEKRASKITKKMSLPSKLSPFFRVLAFELVDFVAQAIRREF